MLRFLSKVTGEESDAKGSMFQVVWALLHVSAAVLHIGSFVYHSRRIRRAEAKAAEQCQRPCCANV